jgi:hypothetical protein
MEVAMSVADDVTKDLTVEDKSRVARGAVIALSGMGVQRYAAVSDTLMQCKEELMDGMRQAKRMVGVMRGQITSTDDAEVAEAFKLAAKLGVGAPDFAGAAAAVLKDALGSALKL